MAIASETGGIWLWVPMQALIPGRADQGPHPHGGADALERRDVRPALGARDDVLQHPGLHRASGREVEAHDPAGVAQGVQQHHARPGQADGPHAARPVCGRARAKGAGRPSRSHPHHDPASDTPQV